MHVDWVCWFFNIFFIFFFFCNHFDATEIESARMGARTRASDENRFEWVDYFVFFFLSGIMYVVQHSTLNAVCIILFWRHWGEGELWDARFLIKLSRTVQCYVLLIRCHGDNTDKNKIKMKPPFWILKIVWTTTTPKWDNTQRKTGNSAIRQKKCNAPKKNNRNKIITRLKKSSFFAFGWNEIKTLLVLLFGVAVSTYGAVYISHMIFVYIQTKNSMHEDNLKRIYIKCSQH